MEATVTVFSAVLALTFAWAAVAKVVRPRRWLDALDGYGFRGRWRLAVTIAVPVAEFTVPALFAIGGARLGAALTLALVAAFSLAVLNARTVQGDRLPCGCFGGVGARDYRLMLARNAALAALAAFVLLTERSRALSGLASGDMVVPIVLSVAGLALIGWMIYQVSVAFNHKEQS